MMMLHNSRKIKIAYATITSVVVVISVAGATIEIKQLGQLQSVTFLFLFHVDYTLYVPCALVNIKAHFLKNKKSK